MKNIKLFILGLTLGIVFLYTPGCTPTEEPKPGTCTKCTASQPWSKPDIANCYVTQTDCEQAEGTGCVLCN